MLRRGVGVCVEASLLKKGDEILVPTSADPEAVKNSYSWFPQ
jgi:hypothetical protein